MFPRAVASPVICTLEKKLEHTVVRRVIAFIDGILKNGVIPSVLEVSVPGVSSKITNLYI